ncbi:MAG TPA: DUF1653 domain-containing protein [Candidatus Absconditabacterales bacterium]|nr:DUF1653 domain-containing protein [Candidatus Absconditabacterales bacterium]HOQ78817.1 DUF1653 domain-containing protein [Candidatus Absconditabacterales bacterium]
MNSIKKGIYKHYKGNLYELIDIVIHSESGEELVLYKALYDDTKGKSQLRVRPKKMFFEDVIIDGIKKPRFEYLGEKI